MRALRAASLHDVGMWRATSLLALSVGCHAPETTAPANARVASDAAAPANARIASDAAVEAAAPVAARIGIAVPAGLEPTVCAGRKPCHAMIVRQAGKDRQGRPLLVATVDLGLAPPDDPDASAAAPPAGEATDDAGADEAVFEATAREDDMGPSLWMRPCHRYEHWLAIPVKASFTTQLLFTSCNDGYGAADIGADTVNVGDRTVTITRSGGSNWRYAEQWTVSLDPVHLRTDTTTRNFTLGAQTEEAKWSWDDFRGTDAWTSPTCDADGNPPTDDGVTDDPGNAASRQYRYIDIPELQFAPAFTEDLWRKTALGGCAAEVDSTGRLGFVVFGSPGAAKDASMRVVASKSTLFVELHDDHWVGPSANWVADDHVELWTSEEDESFGEFCLPAHDADPPKQWAIRTSDGRVFAGAGHPDPAALAVAREESGGVVRLRIELPPRTHGITVVYSDSDDDVRQKRLIATSAIRFGAGPTLGKLYPVADKDAICVVREGKLEPKVARTLARDHAVVGYDPM
ncbi:MAG TPA: hypothetical protein VK841_23530 [Polyangiaceae bacterium]|jgi:hypothetical protein|nr:hypothetical protein [Polyangiaceae bacterium]